MSRVIKVVASSPRLPGRDEGRLRALESADLQHVLDSCLFEPGVWAPDSDKLLPETIPSARPEVTSTACGLLVNELLCSPESLAVSIQDMLDRALDFDTGSYHSPSAPAMLYMIRMAVRVEEYMSAVIRCLRASAGSGAPVPAEMTMAAGCIESCASLMGVVPASVKDVLTAARAKLVGTLRRRAFATLEVWRGKLSSAGQLSEACEVLAHMGFLFRNADRQEDVGGGMDELAVKTLLTCQVFLTHNFAFDLEASQSEFRKLAAESARIERIEFYFSLAQRHRLGALQWIESGGSGAAGATLEDVIAALTSKTKLGPRQSREDARNWHSLSSPSAPGCRGRLCPDTEKPEFEKAIQKADSETDFETWLQVVTTAAVGTEVNVQLGTFTLQSNQTELLDPRFVEAPEFEMSLGMEGAQRLQCAKILKTSQCEHVKLMFRHDLLFWEADGRKPGVAFSYPCVASDWISAGIRRLPDDLRHSSVRFESLSGDVVRGQFTKDAALFEVVVFKTFRGSHLNLFRIESYGRRFLRTLVFSSSELFCFHDMSPSLVITEDNIYEVCCGKGNLNQLGQDERGLGAGLVVTRNLSTKTGEQTYLPRKYLQGILPSGLLGNNS